MVTNGDRVFVVGRWLEPGPWALRGVFETADEAIAACLDGTYFVGPAIMGEVIPAELRPWPGCVYPKNPHETERLAA